VSISPPPSSLGGVTTVVLLVFVLELLFVFDELELELEELEAVAAAGCELVVEIVRAGAAGWLVEPKALCEVEALPALAGVPHEDGAAVAAEAGDASSNPPRTRPARVTGVATLNVLFMRFLHRFLCAFGRHVGSAVPADMVLLSYKTYLQFSLVI
jgi:hypothetical protein